MSAIVLVVLAMPLASFAPDQAIVSMGAGVSGAVDKPLADALHPVGSAWDLRIGFGARARFAFELEYAGTYASLVAPGAAPFLVSNGVSAIARLNFGDWQWQPFLFVGAGYDRIELHGLENDPAAASGFAARADRFLLPVGLGFDVTFVRHLNFDLRAAFRALFGPTLLSGRDDQWSITTHVGYAF